jgi:hypothetical protein
MLALKCVDELLVNEQGLRDQSMEPGQLFIGAQLASSQTAVGEERVRLRSQHSLLVEQRREER